MDLGLQKHKKKHLRILKSAGVFILATLSYGCSNRNIDAPLSSFQAEQIELLTLKNVQEISEGDATSRVIEFLGSPSIVTKKADGALVWVYDKVTSYQEDVEIRSDDKSTTKRAKSSRNLVVTISFSVDQKVEKIAYRYIQF